MRIRNFILLSIIAVLLGSCDANKGKVESMAKDLATAINEKDNVAINDLYPARKDYKNLQVAPSITSESIEVIYNEGDSTYTAKFNEKQSLLFKLKGKEDLEIIDSYGVLKLDSVTYELAAKIGAPINKNSDLENGKLFDEDGALLNYLQHQFPYAIQGNLIIEPSGRYYWSNNRYSFSCEIENTFRNSGEKTVNGDEYDFLIEYFRSNPYERISADTQPGQTISPNATGVIRIQKDNLYRDAVNRNLGWTITANFKNQSKCAMLDKYANLSGNEYEEFMTLQNDEDDGRPSDYYDE